MLNELAGFISHYEQNEQNTKVLLSISFISALHLQLSDYSAVVKTPMWLGNVADKLENQVYKTVGEFVSDVELIFTNCASYNRVRKRR